MPDALVCRHPYETFSCCLAVDVKMRDAKRKK